MIKFYILGYIIKQIQKYSNTYIQLFKKYIFIL